MFNKSSLTVMAMFAGLAFTVQAEMLYQFKFETKDGKTSLSNSGKAGGNAKVVEFAGKGVDFVNDAPVKGLTACNFILQKSRQRAGRLELDNSEKVLRCDKVGDKITFMTWVKWRGFDRPSGIAATCPDGQKSGWGIRIMPDGKLSFAAFGGFGHRSSKQIVPKDKWTHIAFSWNVGNSKGLKFYINGKDAGINLSYIGDKPTPGNSNKIRIGVQTPRFYLPLNGMIYDLRIYNEVLAPEKIAAIAAEVKLDNGKK